MKREEFRKNHPLRRISEGVFSEINTIRGNRIFAYIMSCLYAGVLCFRSFKLFLLYRMYQSVGHSVCMNTLIQL